MSGFLDEASDYVSPFVIVVSKEEVLARDIQPALTILNGFLETPELAKKYKENIDIAFHGYDDTNWELFELEPVREYVDKLDNEFPYWLYFLSKHHLGLQCIVHCFLPPFLTDEGKQSIFPERIDSYLMKRGFPAMNHICQYTGGDSEEEIVEMTDRAVEYIFNGRFKN